MNAGRQQATGVEGGKKTATSKISLISMWLLNYTIQWYFSFSVKYISFRIQFSFCRRLCFFFCFTIPRNIFSLNLQMTDI